MAKLDSFGAKIDSIVATLASRPAHVPAPPPQPPVKETATVQRTVDPRLPRGYIFPDPNNWVFETSANKQVLDEHRHVVSGFAGLIVKKDGRTRACVPMEWIRKGMEPRFVNPAFSDRIEHAEVHVSNKPPINVTAAIRKSEFGSLNLSSLADPAHPHSIFGTPDKSDRFITMTVWWSDLRTSSSATYAVVGKQQFSYCKLTNNCIYNFKTSN
jgi:hypothetical protein